MLLDSEANQGRGKQPAVGPALWSALAKESSAGAGMVLDKSPMLHPCPVVGICIPSDPSGVSPGL